MLVRADCSLKQRPVHTDNNSNKNQVDSKHRFLKQGDFPPQKEAKKQTTVLDFFTKRNPLVTSSISLTQLEAHLGTLPPRSSSLEDIRKKKSSQNKCTNSKCTFCPILDTSGKNSCTVTGEQHTSRYNITCKSSNLIYCITCKTCLKQYVGQTKNSIAQRFYGHTYNIRHKKLTDGVGLHFSREDHHGVKDLKILGLEFIKLPPDSKNGLKLRLLTERKWIHTLGTPAPQGLNNFE